MLALVIVGLLILAAIAVIVTVQRQSSTGRLSRETRQRDTGGAAAPATTDDVSAEARERAVATRTMTGPPARSEQDVVQWEPIDEEELGVTRRQFFNRSILGALGLAVASLGAGVLAFLWPSAVGGFGGVVRTGRTIDDILAEIVDTREPAYFSEARAYIQPYPTADVEDAVDAGYPDAVIPNLEEGFIVLYQKCPHLGCRVPWCQTSQWFECPCHGSKYNRIGEKRDGPAPRGMDMWRGEVGDDGVLSIDTGVEYTGMPFGVDTTEQRPEGPSCI